MDAKFGEVFSKLDTKVDRSDCSVRHQNDGVRKRQITTNATDIEWLKWNQRKAIGAGIAGVIMAVVGIGLALWGLG